MKNQLQILIIILFACFGIETMAQGNLLITPNRVIFEGRKQKEELNLINKGKETTTYSVSFVQRRMNEDGSFEIIQEPDSGQMFADQYVRIYPRKVTLNPGEAQVVMLQCRRSPDMLPGEYRSHLYFRSEKNYAVLGTEEADVDDKMLSVQVTPIFGMTIPIIIRSGEVDASSTLSDLELLNPNDENPQLSFTLNRTGNISIYGNFVVEYLPVTGKQYQVGGKNGVAVYTNIDKRYVSINLNKSTKMNFNQGKLILRYKSRDDAEKQEVFAEAELELK